MQVSIGIKAVLPGFIEPCQPSKVAQPPPSGPLWFHEIKFDGYRLMVRRGGARVRCFTRNGHDWADRFPVSGDLHVSMTRLAARIA
jgi:bifunctional non-homologous end joining protein LigD